jgi:hypothetical protein
VSYSSKEGSTNSTSTKTSLSITFSRALSIDFAECQKVLGKEKQTSRRWGDGDSVFAECLLIHSAKKLPLCRVSTGQHSTKNPSMGPFIRFFAECQGHHTRQRSYTGAQVLVLCRVLWPHSAKLLFAECNTLQSDHYTPFLFVFSISSKQTKDTSQILSHIYITYIITYINIQHKH